MALALNGTVTSQIAADAQDRRGGRGGRKRRSAAANPWCRSMSSPATSASRRRRVAERPRGNGPRSTRPPSACAARPDSASTSTGPARRRPWPARRRAAAARRARRAPTTRRADWPDSASPGRCRRWRPASTGRGPTTPGRGGTSASIPCGESGNWSASIRSVESCAGTSRSSRRVALAQPPPLLDAGLGLQRPQRRRRARRGQRGLAEDVAGGLVAIRLARLQRQLAEGHLAVGDPWIGGEAVGELDVRRHGVVDAPEPGQRLGGQEGGVGGRRRGREVGDDGPQVGEALIDQVVAELGPGDLEAGGGFGRRVGRRRRWRCRGVVAVVGRRRRRRAGQCPSAGSCRAPRCPDGACPARWFQGR